MSKAINTFGEQLGFYLGSKVALYLIGYGLNVVVFLWAMVSRSETILQTSFILDFYCLALAILKHRESYEGFFTNQKAERFWRLTAAICLTFLLALFWVK